MEPVDYRSHEDAAAEGAHPPALSVVIPAYKEAARLSRTLQATIAYLERRKQSYEILVVDDGSPDGTAATAQRWADTPTAGLGRLRILRYEQNRGKGYAVRYGVLRAEGDRILFMDADLATPIEEIEKLEAALQGGGAQFAIGSRPLRASQLLVRQPWYREAAGRGFNKVVQLLATPGIQDTQCGFKLLPRDAAREIFSRCQFDGFSFDVEALFLARRLGFVIAEVPVRWAHQEGAAAFATKGAYLRQGLKMLRDLFQIRWMHRAVHPGLASLSSSPTLASVAAGSTYPRPPVA